MLESDLKLANWGLSRSDPTFMDPGSDNDQITGNDRWCLIRHPDNLPQDFKGGDMANHPQARSSDFCSLGDSSKMPSERP